MDNIELTLERYTELLNSHAMLIALEDAGVDNWEGYDEAMQNYNEEHDI